MNYSVFSAFVNILSQSKRTSPSSRQFIASSTENTEQELLTFYYLQKHTTFQALLVLTW